MILTIFLKIKVWYFIDEDNAQQSKALINSVEHDRWFLGKFS
ncbi:hypothetical protein MICAF_6410002 [Microcystis aeruginosa PCC 9807]|uniref:Uncharacterized protein n=1 Tax=Microcystis aeruginosa PCC 9807 TaxID=1160283 RepID=I4HDT5_MICAE|nr:hypothetical protein MICAF_6410002 [Microcystis aeruginosa PCC 9807]